jgi:outer membrane protein W
MSRKTIPAFLVLFLLGLVFAAPVNANGAEIRQDLKLRIIPVTATVRFLPLGRYASVEPYIGAGIGIFPWRYSEAGEFVDTSTYDIYRASYSDTGTAAGPVIVGGVTFPMGDAFALGGEIRYQRAEGKLSTDFLGDRIDLTGIAYQVVFQVRFGGR